MILYFNTPKDNITFCRKCIEAKDIISKIKNSTTIWRHQFAPTNIIGKMSELYKELNPINVVDFYQKYINSENGKNQEYLERLAFDYKCQVNDKENIPLELYFYDAVCHIIYETYNGMEREKQISNYLKKNTWINDVQTVNNDIDKNYGIDRLLITKKGTFGLQIKPITFFISTYEKRPDTYFDRFGSVVKYFKTKRDKNITTLFAIYEEIKGETYTKYKWFAKDNKILFHIEDLFDNISAIEEDFDTFLKIYEPTKDKNSKEKHTISKEEIIKIQESMKDLKVSIRDKYKLVDLPL